MTPTFRHDSTQHNELEPAPNALDELFAEMNELEDEFFLAHPGAREDVDFDDYPDLSIECENDAY
jgi:hypothetical protein